MSIIKTMHTTGAYNYMARKLYESIRVTQESIIESSFPLNEGIDKKFKKKERGGIITLSTDVNAVSLDKNAFVNWVKQKVETIKNRIKKTSIIDKIAQKHNLLGWTVGKFLDGRYTAKNGKTFGENSLSVEIIGVNKKELISIAEELCEEFSQESVLVKDYNTGSIMFVNSEKEDKAKA